MVSLHQFFPLTKPSALSVWYQCQVFGISVKCLVSVFSVWYQCLVFGISVWYQCLVFGISV